ncbi:MAG TPA: hypothetical protein VFN21_04315 [Acidimicrobiales bacterium]|nr:hypothetical protein [Acidimicrobiales bacterium]
MLTSGHRRVALMFVAAGFVLAACGGGGGGDEQGSATAPDDTTTVRRIGNLAVQTLHSPDGQGYRYSERADTITVTAPESNDPVTLDRFLDTGTGVIGQAFWPNGQPERTDQQVCVELDSVMDGSTKDSATALAQGRTALHLPGVALRVRPGSGGRVTYGIAITQTVHRGQVWLFDVVFLRSDLADTRAAAVTSYIGLLDFGDAVGRVSGIVGADLTNLETILQPPPWNLCASAVGTTLSVMVWPDSAEKPSWSDSDAVQEVKLSRNLVYAGYAGGYVQGLSPGYSSKFVGLSVTSPY